MTQPKAIASSIQQGDICRASTPVARYFGAYRYRNHAGPSGYDQFANYLGQRVGVSPRMRFLGNTLLRLPTKLIGWYNGSYEYSRHDCVQEMCTYWHMRQHRNAIYHFLYAEKSLRFLGSMNGRRNNRLIGSFHHCSFKYPLYFRSTKHFSRLEHAVVVSRAQIEHMESIVGKGRISFVPYGVDATYFRPSDITCSSRPLQCTCVGQHLRDVERLPAIVEGILSRNTEVEFYLVGMHRTCRPIANRPRVHWKEGISDAEYLEILQNTDALVLPLIDSTSVTSVNEALACGVPIVTNIGGVADYLNPQCSVMLPVGDVDGMIDVVVDLLENESRRKEMAGHARSRGLELHWPRVATKMNEVYSKVAESMA